MIHFTPKRLQKLCRKKVECGLVATVEGLGGSKSEVNDFSIKAYQNLVRLIERTPVSSSIEEEQYAYFDFYNTCKGCQLIITATTYSVGKDVDIFVVEGSKKGFPTREEHDYNATEWSSEVLEIDSAKKGLYPDRRHGPRRCHL